MNIVLLSTYFRGNKASANGLCAQEIYKELQKSGNNVYVICNKSECEEDDRIHEVLHEYTNIQRPRFFERISSYLDVVRVHYNEKKVDDYYLELKKIVSEYAIDIVVAMYFPIEALIASAILKQEIGSFNLVLFELDSFGDGIQRESVILKWKIRTYNKFLREYYDKCDSIIVMKSHVDYWVKNFASYQTRLKISDIPMLTFNLEENDTIKHEYKKGIYAGLLDKKYRNPTYLLDVFQKHRKLGNDFELHFYSKGDCEDELIEISTQIPQFLYRHGYVDKSLLDNEIKDCDFLISIGNSNSRSVPSKLISYIATGKPIIHFSKIDDDVCISYLHRYPNAIVIMENDCVEDNLLKIDKLWLCFNKIKPSITEIAERYKENMPSYSAQLIESVCVQNMHEKRIAVWEKME